MARDVLATTASTVASKSAFSTGGRIISNYRSSLSCDTIEALMSSRLAKGSWFSSCLKISAILKMIWGKVSKKLNVKQEELSPILGSLRGRAAPDLESVTMSLKNASYTSGFHAGFETIADEPEECS